MFPDAYFSRVLRLFYSRTLSGVDENDGMSNRDDLLREIALMKNLGSHPNIVTMIGACTKYEPIALLMEYMPYGNLQTFLK